MLDYADRRMTRPDRSEDDVRLAADFGNSPSPDVSDWWGRERFLTPNGDHEPQICPEVLDITGQRRYLVMGTLGGLGAGHWRATAVLELCPDAARRPIAVEFGADPEQTIVYVPQRSPGRHEIDLDYVMKPGDIAQLRIYLVRAAFHGELRFLGARLQRIADSSSN